MSLLKKNIAFGVILLLTELVFILLIFFLTIILIYDYIRPQKINPFYEISSCKNIYYLSKLFLYEVRLDFLHKIVGYNGVDLGVKEKMNYFFIVMTFIQLILRIMIVSGVGNI